MATGAYLYVFFVFFVYMLAASVFYGWPALLTFGFSGNPALLLLLLNCHDCCLFESNKYLLLLLYLRIVAQIVIRHSYFIVPV